MRGAKPRPIKDRFEEKYIPEPTTGCWLWTATADSRGYGSIHFGNKMKKAHRIAYMLYKSTPPEDMEVCHLCNTPSCVNPDQLFLGTRSENMIHAVMTGVQPTKLDKESVRVIRKSEGSGESIGKLYGVSGATINRIRQGVIWKGVK